MLETSYEVYINENGEIKFISIEENGYYPVEKIGKKYPYLRGIRYGK